MAALGGYLTNSLGPMRETWVSADEYATYGHSIDGKVYKMSHLSEAIGKPEWVEAICASCGQSHGATVLEEDGMCEFTRKAKNKRLHDVFFERYKSMA